MTEPLDLDSIEIIFEVPEAAWDGGLEWRRMYYVIIHNLQRESVGIPLDTVQKMLLERLSNIYVTIKWREATGGFKHANEQKDANTFLMQLFQQWERVIQSTDIEQRKMLTREFMDSLVTALKKVDNIDRPGKVVLVKELAGELKKSGWSVGDDDEDDD
jgi:hypothetical protein